EYSTKPASSAKAITVSMTAAMSPRPTFLPPAHSKNFVIATSHADRYLTQRETGLIPDCASTRQRTRSNVRESSRFATQSESICASWILARVSSTSIRIGRSAASSSQAWAAQPVLTPTDKIANTPTSPRHAAGIWSNIFAIVPILILPPRPRRPRFLRCRRLRRGLCRRRQPAFDFELHPVRIERRLRRFGVLAVDKIERPSLLLGGQAGALLDLPLVLALLGEEVRRPPERVVDRKERRLPLDERKRTIGLAERDPAVYAALGPLSPTPQFAELRLGLRRGRRHPRQESARKWRLAELARRSLTAGLNVAEQPVACPERESARTAQVRVEDVVDLGRREPEVFGELPHDRRVVRGIDHVVQYVGEEARGLRCPGPALEPRVEVLGLEDAVDRPAREQVPVRPHLQPRLDRGRDRREHVRRCAHELLPRFPRDLRGAAAVRVQRVERLDEPLGQAAEEEPMLVRLRDTQEDRLFRPVFQRRLADRDEPEGVALPERDLPIVRVLAVDEPEPDRGQRDRGDEHRAGPPRVLDELPPDLVETLDARVPERGHRAEHLDHAREPMTLEVDRHVAGRDRTAEDGRRRCPRLIELAQELAHPVRVLHDFVHGPERANRIGRRPGDREALPLPPRLADRIGDRVAVHREIGREIAAGATPGRDDVLGLHPGGRPRAGPAREAAGDLRREGPEATRDRSAQERAHAADLRLLLALAESA